MNGLTRFVLKRPITTLMAVLCLIVFGYTSVTSMSLENIPDMEMPVLMVMTTYSGASPEDVNEIITKPIEDQVGTLSGLKSVTSNSSEGSSMVMLEYEYGTDTDEAYDDLKKKVDLVKNSLPDSAGDPMIMEMDMNSQPVITLAVGGQVDGNLYTYVENNIQPELEKLGSVGEVSLAGGQKEYISIKLDPEKVAQYGLSMSRIAQFVGAADFTIPAGDVNVGKQNLSVSVGNDFDNTEALKNVAIPLANGDVIHLSDVATVSNALEDADSIGRYNGQDIVSVSIKKQQSSTAIDVSKDVLKQVSVLEKTYPGLTFTVVNDSSDMITESITNVFQTMIMAVILSMIILWLFYGDIRASVIVGTSIPISIMLTLIAMSLMGFSLNVISLTSLVLGVGMMVDNSINVLDGCFRAKEHRNFFDAAIEGSRIMITSIVGGTATTCVVFIPLAMLSGLSGQMFKQLGFTIVFSLIASLFSAVTIVPLCYYQWHPVEKENAPVAGFIRKCQEIYRNIMPGIIPKTKTVISASILLLVFSFFLASRLDVKLMVSTDEGIVDVTVKTKPGLSVAAVNDTVSQIENMVANDEEVDHYLLTSGSSGLSTMGGSSVTLSAYLKDDRKMSTDEVIDKWTRETENYKDISVTMEQGSTTSSSMSSTNQIEVDLQSTDYDALKKASDELVEELRKREDVMQVHSSIENAAPVIKVNVDPVLAQAEGLTPASIGSLIYSNLSGIKATTVRVNGEDTDVY